ncbi:MAG: hypothetical protein ACW98F_13700 [Candidatus Hodarchaeales archaeon]|jgi:hypothetical protein
MQEYEFHDILEPEERVLVTFKPRKLVNFIRSFAGLIITLFGSPFLMTGLIALSYEFFNLVPSEHINISGENQFFVGVIFSLVGGALVFIPINNILNTPKKMSNTIYAVSTKNIITRLSKKEDIEYICDSYHSVKEIDIDVGFLDKIFGTGTLTFKGMPTKESDRNIELGSFPGIKNPISIRSKILGELIQVKSETIKSEF